MSELIINKEIYESLASAGQQFIIAGADEEKVKSFIKELAPFYQTSPKDLQKQERIGKDIALPAADGRAKVELPTAHECDWWEEGLIHIALLMVSPLLGVSLAAARVVSKASSLTIGIGPQLSGGILAGLGGGCGFCAYPNGKLGYYGSINGLAGAVASISLTFQVIIINGGSENFSGLAYAVGLDGGEIVVGNGAALLSPDGKFLGITLGVGVGLGMPVDIFFTAQHTWA